MFLKDGLASILGQRTKDELASEWVIHRGRRIRSRVKRVKRRVVNKTGEVEQEPRQEIILRKQRALDKAMSLNGDLARLVKRRQDLEAEIGRLQLQLGEVSLQIKEVESNDFFLKMDQIGKLYDEISTLRTCSSIDALSSSKEDPEFDESEVLCSVCTSVTQAFRVYWCHKCGRFTCEQCIRRTQQCPKCVDQSIDDYSIKSAHSLDNHYEVIQVTHDPDLVKDEGQYLEILE